MTDAAPWAWAVDPPPSRAPQVVLIAFARTPLEPAAAAGLEVRAIERARDPAWFDGWRAGFLRQIAERDLGVDLAALDAADHLALITAAPAAPPDLGYLQAAWSAARAAVAGGATVVLDVHRHTYHRGADLPAADLPLDVAREVRVVFETTADTVADRAHALHTRGLKKFGASDLVALCGTDDVALVGRAITQLADLLARGADTRRLVMSPTSTWHLVADRDGLAALLELGNTALILVDERGQHLLGAAARRAPS